MRNVQTTSWVRRVTAFSMSVVLFSTSIMFAFAGTPVQTFGEIAISGGSSTARFVWLNGEKAFSGRTFVSGGLIATEADGATVRLKNGSSIRLEPNSSVDLSFSETSIGGRVISGKVDVYAAPGVEVNVATPDSTVSNRNSDEKRFSLDLTSGTTTMKVETGSVVINNGTGPIPVGAGGDDERDSNGKCIDTDKDGKLECDDNGGGMAGWKPVALFAGIVGAAVVALFIATRDNEESPRR